jgi:hypothetical protein
MFGASDQMRCTCVGYLGAMHTTNSESQSDVQ